MGHVRLIEWLQSTSVAAAASASSKAHESRRCGLTTERRCWERPIPLLVFLRIFLFSL
jgi:hypothetical protein